MPCKLPNYIDKNVNTIIENSGIDVSTDKVEQIKNNLARTYDDFVRTASKSNLFIPSKIKDKKALFAGMKGKTSYNNAIKWVKEQNDKIGYNIYEIPDDSILKKDSDARYLRINFSDYLVDTLNRELEEEGLKTTIKEIQEDADSFNFASSKLRQDKVLDYINSFVETSDIEDNIETFRSIFNKTKENLGKILPQLGDNDLYKAQRGKTLKNLYNYINNVKSIESLEFAFNMYFNEGIKRASVIGENLSELTQSITDLSDLTGDLRTQKVEEVFSKYKNFSLWLESLEFMEDFRKVITTDFSYWSSLYNRELLEDNLIEFLVDKGLSEDEAIQRLSEAFFDNNFTEKELSYFLASLFETVNFKEFNEQLDKVYQNSRLRDKDGKPLEKSIQEKFLESLHFIADAKQNLIKINKNFIMNEFIIPEVKKAWKVDSLRLMGDSENEAPTIEELERWLEITKDGIAVVDTYIGSISSNRDQVLQAIVKRFRTEFLLADNEKKFNLFELANLLPEEKDFINNNSQRTITTLWGSDLTEAKPEDENVLEYTFGGITKRYKANITKALVGEYKFAEYQDNKRAFYAMLPEIVNSIKTKEDIDSLVREFSALTGLIYNSKGELKSNIDWKTSLISAYFSKNTTTPTEEEKLSITNGWEDILSNSNETEKKELIKSKILPYISNGKEISFYKGKSNIESENDKLVTVNDKVLIQYTDGSLGLVSKDDLTKEYIDEQGIDSYFYYAKKSIRLKDQWKDSNYDIVKDNPYYQKLVEMYHKSNDILINSGVKSLILPQVRKRENEGFLDILKKLLTNPSQFFKDLKAWFYGTDDKEYDKEKLTPFYTKLINNIEELEDDLFVSIMSYNNMAVDFKYKTKLQNAVYIIDQRFKGSRFLNLQGRKEKVKKRNFMNYLGLSQDIYLDQAVSNENTLKLWDNFINVNLYNKGVNNKGIAKVVKSLINYGALALNLSTIIPNFAIGQINNYGYGVAQHIYTEKQWLEAVGEYFSPQSVFNIKRFAEDSLKSNIAEKSKISQLFNMFGGTISEAPDLSSISSKKFYERFKLGEFLYFTSSAPEHSIQSIAMIATMKGFNLSSGKTLWEDINFKEGEAISFGTATKEELAEFKGVFDKIKTQLHGNYGNLDKTVLQSHSLLSFALMFKKWIYDSFKSRYGREYRDFTLQQDIEGFHMKFLKQMFRDYQEIEINAQTKLVDYLKTAKSIGKGIGRIGAATLDTLTLRTLSKNEEFSKWVYKSEDAADVRLYMRASFELALFLGLAIVVSGLHAMNEDDEEKNLFLASLEYYATRIQKDLGTLLPYANFPVEGGSGFFVFTDNFYRVYKDPLTIGRTANTYVDLFSQLTTDVRNLELEQYDRGGYGYEKGDYKLTRKLEQTALAPIWQIIRLSEPEDQLKSLNVVYKNSN